MSTFGIFESGKPVNVEITLDVLDASGATWCIYDAAGGLVVADMPLTLTEGDLSVAFQVPGEYNVLPEGAGRDLRRVEVTVETTGGLRVTHDQSWVLIASFELDVPGQSFISLLEAKLAAIDLIGCESFLMTNDGARRQALIEATSRIKALPFSWRKVLGVDYDDYDRPQNQLNVIDIPWGKAGQYRHDRIDFSTMTEDEYAELPEGFRTALSQACLTETVALIKGDDVAAARDEGLLSESIGETTNMYRTGRTAQQAISRKSWRILAEYTDSRMFIRRS
ncbi:hypothetical protein MWH03_00165 [Klebsiella pneumoniae]|nr:hypothetical protein [Klebsiella pneumoniae]